MSYYFTVKDSVEIVQGRTGAKADARVKYLTDSLVKHLHAFLKEARPTMDCGRAVLNQNRSGLQCLASGIHPAV